MPEITKHEPGMFSWVDLLTTDSDGAKAFYTALFGWEPVDIPVDDENAYTMLKKNGKAAAAVFEMTPEMAEQGMATHWGGYVTVEDADAVAARTEELGGTVVYAPMDVFDAGRMTVIRDPGGAVLSAWQPKESIGAEVMSEPGAFTWCELYTHDTDAAAAFYGGLFGWTRKIHQMPDGEYNEFQSGGKAAGGMLAIRPEWGEVPPNWTVYFVVESIEPALEQVKALGGRVHMPPMTIPTVGTFAAIADPQQGYLMLIELEEPLQ